MGDPRGRRRIRIAPGIHLNLGLHGAGLSIGPRGLHVGMNRRGMYTSAGIPGTGIYAVHHVSSSPGESADVQGNARAVMAGLLVAFAVVVLLAVLALIRQ